MRYDLVYTRRAGKDIQKLDPAIKRQLGNSHPQIAGQSIGIF